MRASPTQVGLSHPSWLPAAGLGSCVFEARVIRLCARVGFGGDIRIGIDANIIEAPLVPPPWLPTGFRAPMTGFENGQLR